MYNLKGKQAIKMETITFSELGMQESDIEELLRVNIDMLCDEEESMLIIGRQVKNEKLGRSDLTGIDNNGNIVLIEIKRDRKDIENRKEAFEFQAIRYAASYATIVTVDDLVKKVYAPYIEKYRTEFELEELTSYELGIRKINEFLNSNGAENNFNKNQKVVLVSSDYDEQTLSAVAWLNSNGVNIICYKLIPYNIEGEVYIDLEKLLPITDYEDYYVNLLDTPLSTAAKQGKRITRRSLPKIKSMIEWGVLKDGDVLITKEHNKEAILLQNGKVKVDDKDVSLQTWLKDVYEWQSVDTYNFTIHKERGKTLFQIREEYMEHQLENDD
ncbi:hypothetical protein [Paenibacillus illinoisensis]|uniref:hypothetical protein n=1 Tax=Paenibacillus illinoisensis TaxID=59845 RepID=UPI00301DCD93